MIIRNQKHIKGPINLFFSPLLFKKKMSQNDKITFDEKNNANNYQVTYKEESSSHISKDSKKSTFIKYMMRKKNLIRRNSSDIVSSAVEGPPYHTMKIETVAQLLKSDIENGLSESMLSERQAQYGLNEMEGDGGVNPVKLMLKQFFNVMVLILVIAMVVSFVFKDWVEGGVIAFIMLMNAAIGFAQEYKAERTMESLRQMASPTSEVIRDGHQKTIATRDLVPGDIIVLKNGDVVGADCRVIESFNMDIDEALLTGESLPVNKM